MPGSRSQAQTPLSPFQFVGKVEIAGHRADLGTVVEVVVFRTAQDRELCGEGRVGLTQDGEVSGYQFHLENRPACLNPDNQYDFYVNGVRGGSARNVFSPTSQLAYLSLAVPEVALRTPHDAGLMLVWLYGRVKDQFGRAVPKKTKVTAEAREVPECKGTGMTEDVYWMSTSPYERAYGAKGFYWIGIPLTTACQDRKLTFDVYVGESKEKKTSSMSSVNMHTPPYGNAYSANVDLKGP